VIKMQKRKCHLRVEINGKTDYEGNEEVIVFALDEETEVLKHLENVRNKTIL